MVDLPHCLGPIIAVTGKLAKDCRIDFSKNLLMYILKNNHANLKIKFKSAWLFL
jgi:hypothetical protein